MLRSRSPRICGLQMTHTLGTCSWYSLINKFAMRCLFYFIFCATRVRVTLPLWYILDCCTRAAAHKAVISRGARAPRRPLALPLARGPSENGKAKAKSLCPRSSVRLRLRAVACAAACRALQAGLRRDRYARRSAGLAHTCIDDRPIPAVGTPLRVDTSRRVETRPVTVLYDLDRLH